MTRVGVFGFGVPILVCGHIIPPSPCKTLHTIPLAVPSFTPRIVATALIYNPPFLLRYALIKREMAAADVAAGRNQKPYLPDH